MSGSPYLEVKDLTKLYGQFVAVDHLSLKVQPGQVLGLLGPNGAGKTTTIQMLLGLTTQDGGQIKFFGKDFQAHQEEILHHINFASAYSEIQGKITIEQNLIIYGGLYKVKNVKQRIKYLLDLLEISHLKDMTYWKLSAGQKTRAILAKALINSPKMLLLDEPTASLDPDIILKFIDLIKKLQEEESLAILYTSHNMEEVTRICDEVIFLYDGKIVAQDTPLNLTKLIGDSTLLVTFDGDQDKVKKYLNSQNLEHKFVRKHLVKIVSKDETASGILFGLKEAGIWITDIDIQRPTLEDVFVTLSRKGLDGLAQN